MSLVFNSLWDFAAILLEIPCINNIGNAREERDYDKTEYFSFVCIGPPSLAVPVNGPTFAAGLGCSNGIPIRPDYIKMGVQSFCAQNTRHVITALLLTSLHFSGSWIAIYAPIFMFVLRPASDHLLLIGPVVKEQRRQNGAKLTVSPLKVKHYVEINQFWDFSEYFYGILSHYFSPKAS